MVKILRVVGLLEGLSLLMLFGIAMPLKYLFREPLAVEVVGMAHGILFIFYILLVLLVGYTKRWKLTNVGLAMLASIIPFGTFYVDKKIFILYDAV
jgi:integral membrane protein